MERIYAPWRSAYFSMPKEGGCLFCDVQRTEHDSEVGILARATHWFVILNMFPYTSGHLMVSLRRHEDSLLGGSDAERAEVPAALERARRALTTEYRPDGFNLGLNLGAAAGAGVPGHLHWHIVPRWSGDTNFMPAVAATRVLPEALSETYRRLLAALAALPPQGLRVTDRGHAPS